MKVKTLIDALRCTVTAGYKCKRFECPYFGVCNEDEIEAFLKEQGKTREDFPDDLFEGCDFDKIARDAADILERMVGVETDF